MGYTAKYEYSLRYLHEGKPPNQTNIYRQDQKKTLGDLVRKGKIMRMARIWEGRQTGLDNSKAIRSSIEIIRNNKAIAVQKLMELRIDL